MHVCVCVCLFAFVHLCGVCVCLCVKMGSPQQNQRHTKCGTKAHLLGAIISHANKYTNWSLDIGNEFLRLLGHRHRLWPFTTLGISHGNEGNWALHLAAEGLIKVEGKSEMCETGSGVAYSLKLPTSVIFKKILPFHA